MVWSRKREGLGKSPLSVGVTRVGDAHETHMTVRRHVSSLDSVLCA